MGTFREAINIVMRMRDDALSKNDTSAFRALNNVINVLVSAESNDIEAMAHFYANYSSQNQGDVAPVEDK